MTFIKGFWKSSLLGALSALVLLYIGTLIYNGLPPNTTQEVVDANKHNTAKPPGAAPGGYWHGDQWHDAPHTSPPKIKRARPDTRQNRALKNIGSILPITSPIPPPLLPTDIQSRLDQLYKEMVIAGTMYKIQDGEKVVTETAYKRNFEILVGGMTPEDAVAFLETYQIYNPYPDYDLTYDGHIHLKGSTLTFPDRGYSYDRGVHIQQAEDVNGDGVIDNSDLNIVASNITDPQTYVWSLADVNNDRSINISDLVLVAQKLGNTATEFPHLPEDVNGDRVVNILDLLVVSSNMGQSGTTHTADVNCDGTVNILDLVRVASAFGYTVASSP